MGQPSDFMGPLEDLIPYAAADWAGADLDLVDGSGYCARYIKVVAVGAAPSLVLNLRNGQTRTYNAANSLMAAEWETPHGLQIKSIDITTANITTVLVGR